VFTLQADALPLKKRVLRGRRLVVVDIENLVGGAVMTVEQAHFARGCVEGAIGLGPDEQVVIGTSHVGMLASGLGWPGSRIVVRSGENGADLALLEVLEGERLAERFDEVVLASGDGIFTDAVSALGAEGVHVTVVARPDACSKRLRMAAGQAVLLADTAVGVGGAA